MYVCMYVHMYILYISCGTAQFKLDICTHVLVEICIGTHEFVSSARSMACIQSLLQAVRS